MKSSMMWGVRGGLALLAAGTIMGSVAAQTPPGAGVQALAPDAGAQLRSYLTTLGNNPRSLDALVGAGRAALRLGDADAALTFFGRADEVSPRNARVKAGMATALVQLGQPQAALSLFAEAVALGAPEAEIIGDRGLAYDMIGAPRRAQQDYVAALRRRDDAEVRRRLALSLAISGQRDAALRTIDAQLRRNDRAAWRTQAFILALTGDAAGAGRTAQTHMPAGGAEQMAPFFARLHHLGPAQKAMAVHLGRFPSNGARTQTVQADIAADPGALAFAGIPTAARPRNETATTSRPQSRYGGERDVRTRWRERSEPNDPDRRSSVGGREPRDADVAPAVERHVEVAEVDTRWADSPARAQAQTTTSDPQAAAPVQPPPPVSAETTQPSPPPTQEPAVVSVPVPASDPSPPASTPAEPSSALASPTVGLRAPDRSSSVQDPLAEAESGAPSLADIAALVNALPQEAEAQAAPPRPAARESAEPTRVAAAPSIERRSSPPQPAHPRRHWVQIAGGLERASLPREFARLRALAPDQLGGRAAFTSPLRITSRLLVGPFDSAGEAQAFVNQLARRNVEAFAWTSPAGQEIERLATR